MPYEFTDLAERIVDAVLESSPRRAAMAGDHRFDHRLPDYSPDSVARDVAMLRDASGALSQVDEDALDPEEQVDHAVLQSLVEQSLFELTEVRAHEWDPLPHNPGQLLHQLIARPYAAADERLTAIAGRLSAVPDALATARQVLDGCPRIHLETAVGQFAGAAVLLRDELPPLMAQAPALAGEVEPMRRRAINELESFVDWLRERLQHDEPGRDPRLGRRLWEARLWHTLDTELTAAEVLARAEANLEQVTEALREAAAKYSAAGSSGATATGAPATDQTVRNVLDRLADDHPDDATIVQRAREAFEETTAFVRQYELVSLVDDPCEILQMPEFARGVAVAYCSPPGPLEHTEGRAVPTFYCIAPTPAGWSAERVRSFYREYNNHMVRNLTVHEAMPGHFLQLAHARRFRSRTRVRALGWSVPFVEGWAVYAEEMMADFGYAGLPGRLHQLKMQLRSTLNAILDQRVHCDGIAEADALALLTERGFQEEGEAAGKWRRALLTSGQLSTYFVGYTEVAAVAAARPPGTDVRAWHDEMLAHGSPPPRHLRRLLLT